jgi:multidrug efflux system membrane fusion protein
MRITYAIENIGGLGASSLDPRNMQLDGRPPHLHALPATDHKFLRNAKLISGLASLGFLTCYLTGLAIAQDNNEPSATAVPVRVATSATADVPILLTGLGTVQAYNRVIVQPRVDGELQQVLFTEGQMVKKGDLLAVIDPRPYQAALDQASAKIQQDQANLDNAQVTLARFQQLASQDYATRQALDNQRSTVEQLKAQIAQDVAARNAAAVQLSYTELKAPLDGRTGVRLIDPGNIIQASANAGLVVINQTRPISVVSTLPQETLARVRAAMEAGSVPVDAFAQDGASWIARGSLTLINNEITQANGTIQLKSTFPNTDEALWPGQFVELRLQQQIVKGAVTVPSAAVQRGQQGFFVYVVGHGDKVEARTITVGQISDERALVKSGLAAGERVVISDSYRLEPGTRISIQTQVPASSVDPAKK